MKFWLHDNPEIDEEIENCFIQNDSGPDEEDRFYQEEDDQEDGQ